MSVDATPSVRLREAVAEEIRALLGRRSMSKLQLARELDKSHTYLWRRLSGETAFDVDDLEQISKVLDVGVVDLLPVDQRKGLNRSYGTNPLGERVVAVGGAVRRSRSVVRAHRPGRAVTRTRPRRRSTSRPLTPALA